MTRVILIAATPRDSSGQAVPVRLQGGGRFPAQFQGAAWLPVLTDWPDLQQALPFDGLTFGGGSAANIGQLRFALNGGRFAWLTELVWTRAPVTFYIGEDGDDASFAVLWRGRARSLVADANDAELTLADPALVLERALLTGRYAGTGGAEGDASVQGVLKRLAWGQPNNVGLTLIEKANLIYASVDQAVVFRGIKQGGLSQGVSGDVASLAALRAAVIPAGRVATCAALGLVRPAAEPTYPLTADLTIAGPRAPAALAGTLAARAGLTFAAGQIAAFDSLGQEIDLVVSDDLTLRQTLDQIFAPLGAWWRLNAAGELECGRYLDPAAATVSLPGHLTLSYRRLATQPPVWRSVIGHDINWRPLADGEIAGIIRAAEVEGLGALATQDGVDWGTQVGGDGKPENNATVGAPAGTLVGSIPAEWLHLGATDNLLFEDFTTYADASEIVPAVWLRRSGSGELSLDNSSLWSGGRALRAGNNSGNDELWITTARSIPFDPNATYRISAALYQSSGAGRVYVGVEGRALDGINLVNANGNNSIGDQHFLAAAFQTPPTGQLVVYTGYFRGYGSPNASPGIAPDIGSPARLHANVRRIAPVVIGNYSSVTGIVVVVWVRLERLTDGYAEVVINASEAADRLVKLGSDSLIAQEEKAQFVREINTLLTSADQVVFAANNVSLSPANPNQANWAGTITTYKNSLTSLLASYTTPSLWSDTTGDTNINSVSLGSAISTLSTGIAHAQAAISTRASLLADWPYIGGPGRPEDYATNDRGVDTRNDNFSPAYYRQFFPLRVRTEFKSRTVISAPGTAQFGALQTLAKWADDTGGPVEQQFTSDNGVFYRRGTNAGGWGAWTTSFDTLNRPDVSSGHLLNGGSQLAPGQLLNSSIVVNADGTTSYYDGVAWRNLGAVTIRGLGYTGDTDATNGADWYSNVRGRPSELVDGTVIDTRNRSSRLRTNGRANGNLLPTGNNSGATSALLSAPITGLTSSSITIAPHTRYIFGSAVYYNGGTILGLSPSTRYYIYADDPDELGGAVTYLATTDFSAISGANRIYFGPAMTAAAGNPGGGGGGGGGELPPADYCVDISMFVDHGLRAGAVMPGDQVWCMDDAGTPVGLRPITQAVEAQAVCLRLTAKNGAAVIVSTSAPLWTLNRGLIRAGEAELGDVVMTRLCQTDLLSPLVAVAAVGFRRVRKIHVQGISYAAGVDAAALIYTHNPTYKP